MHLKWLYNREPLKISLKAIISRTRLPWLLLQALVLLLSSALSLTNALRDLTLFSDDLIYKICSKNIINLSYCLKTLQSDDPCSSGADLTCLGYIPIDLAESAANLMKSIKQQTN